MNSAAHNARHRISWLCGLLLTVCLNSVQAQAVRTDVPLHIRNEIPEAVLQGSGSYRWFGLRIYDASLWTEPQGWQGNNPHFALDLTYARSLYGRKIAEASLTEIEKLKFGSTEQHQRWLQQMNALFPDVNEGSRITGIYHAGNSARFYLNGKWLGEIKDPEFAKAFFAIWLDPRTSAPRLREQLILQTR